MTCVEKLTLEHPRKFTISCYMGHQCPHHFNYLDKPDYCDGDTDKCKECWDREIPEEKSEFDKWICKDCAYMVNPTTEDGSSYPICDHPDVGGKPCGDAQKCSGYVKKQDTPMALLGHNDPEMITPVIKDSGNRRRFETGAVRDIHEGKGRCDLLPLDTVARFRGQILADISQFQDTGDIKYLENAVQRFTDKHYNKDMSTMLLEVSKHFEEGCKKYGENNWRKGIPTRCYIDSAVRHYLKYLRGDRDEPHDRAFCWNILCCIWTCIHKPELNDYGKDKK